MDTIRQDQDIFSKDGLGREIVDLAALNPVMRYSTDDIYAAEGYREIDSRTTIPDMIVTDTGTLQQRREQDVLSVRDFMTLPDIRLYSGEVLFEEFDSFGTAVIQLAHLTDGIRRMVVQFPDNIVLRQESAQLYEMIGVLH